MNTQTQPLRKLELKKKTISKLGQAQQNYDGGSTTVIYFTNGCGSDFTRTSMSTISISISISH